MEFVKVSKTGIKIRNDYYSLIQPIPNSFGELLMLVNKFVPKLLSGSITTIIDFQHVFDGSKVDSDKFYYCCSKLFCRYTGQPIFETWDIDGVYYLRLKINVKRTDIFYGF